ncbi:hypothetical protein [Flavobacterium piscis]|uniref:DUF4468 domain-containing protein n=1 Tax=Flavobacterium piscis TaxID=1114874 RepID=A0ABU1Y4S4_9FLAO|nr:hypothetical protein [Flavobacterium piscis]MDR7209058.1 hypothetical protein [Flavobacterium piscis]
MRIKFLLLILFTSFIGFSQTINDYKAVIVPIKFDFAKGVNPHRMSTLTKSNLIKAGFEAFYENEQLPAGYGERCELLYADIKKESGFLVSKLYIEFKDCYGKVIYTSEIGKSKEKEYDVAYRECIDQAFLSIYKLGYKYNGKKTVASENGTTTVTKSVPAVTSAPAAATMTPVADMADPNLLYAQPTENGFQLIDKTPKVVMKLLKTSRPDSFIAIKDGVQGTLNAKDNQWFFEYYQNDKLISEKISVKF